jgi:hypothetical protein
MQRWVAIGTAALFSFAPLLATAADGRLEISQACVATGCFPGDSPGFPVTASSASSYVLTSNLTLSDADDTAISLGSGASLDLGGFTISGPTVCTGTPATCTGTGSGSGIGAGSQTKVSNGRITGMGNSGISGSDDMQITDVTITSNGGNGIIGQGGFVITRCVIDRNGYDGISLAAGQVGGTVIQNNAVHRNAQVGIRASIAVVKDNGVKQNGSFGFLGTSSALSGNQFYNNNSFGDQISGGVEIGENVCNSSTTCP